jgi:hypothetical protein
MKYSKDAKLNRVLQFIESELEELGLGEVRRYRREFKTEPDYNIAQYGNLTIWHGDLAKIYAEYKTLENASNSKLWDIYRRQVGYVARQLTNL